jgi:hypothetical protein
MYLEPKGGGIAAPVEGAARIGLVRFSKTGRTLYYGGRSFRSLDGSGYKASHYDVDSGEWYWISGCRADGLDALYPTVIEIDEDVRDEYWRSIRAAPDRVAEPSFRSDGKHTKSRGPNGGKHGAQIPRRRSSL